MERYLSNFFFVSIIALCVLSCKSLKNISSECQIEKIHFDINLLDKNGRDPKINQPIDYEFCITDNEMDFASVLRIDSQLKKSESKGRSKCGKEEVMILGNTDNKDFKSILCKISNLDSVKEINQTFWE